MDRRSRLTSCCTACDWADEWLAKLERSEIRRARLRRERFKPDAETLATREYDDKTEQLTRWLRGQHYRKDVA